MTSALLRYLSVNGDGSGSISGAVDGSTIPVELNLVPESGTEFRVYRLSIMIEDNSTLAADKFGSSELTNGVRLRVLDDDDVVLRELDAGRGIKRLADFLGTGGAQRLDDTSGSNKFSVYLFSFVEPIVLNGNRGMRLAVTIQDDLSNLVLLTF